FLMPDAMQRKASSSFHGRLLATLLCTTDDAANLYKEGRDNEHRMQVVKKPGLPAMARRLLSSTTGCTTVAWRTVEQFLIFVECLSRWITIGYTSSFLKGYALYSLRRRFKLHPKASLNNSPLCL